MFHPVHIIALLEVVTGMSTTALLTGLSTMHSHGGVTNQVLELQSLNEVGVPDHRAILDPQAGEFTRDLIQYLATLCKHILHPKTAACFCIARCSLSRSW